MVTLSLQSHYLGSSLMQFSVNHTLYLSDTPLGKLGEQLSTTRKLSIIYRLTYSANKFLKIHKLCQKLNSNFLVTRKAIARAELYILNKCLIVVREDLMWPHAKTVLLSSCPLSDVLQKVESDCQGGTSFILILKICSLNKLPGRIPGFHIHLACLEP